MVPIPHCHQETVTASSSFFHPELFVVRLLEGWSDFSLTLIRKHRQSFSSSVTIAAVTSGIKTEQEDYTAAYYWLSFLIIIISV